MRPFRISQEKSLTIPILAFNVFNISCQCLRGNNDIKGTVDPLLMAYTATMSRLYTWNKISEVVTLLLYLGDLEDGI